MKETRAILLISCKDKPGIVSQVANFIFENKGNILNLEQHVEDPNRFFARFEWSLEKTEISAQELRKKLTLLLKNFQANWKLKLKNSESKKKVAIFVSKYTHCLLDLLWRKEFGELDFEIPVIISNHLDSEKISREREIEYKYLPVQKENKRVVEEKQLEILLKYKIDLIVLARYMQILTGNLIKHYPEKIINIHHSFLPAFVGGNPYQQAFDKGVKIIGATSHYVTEELDQGPIIEQETTRISHQDSLSRIIQKGRDLERLVLSRALRADLEERIIVFESSKSSRENKGAQKTIVFSQ